MAVAVAVAVGVAVGVAVAVGVGVGDPPLTACQYVDPAPSIHVVWGARVPHCVEAIYTAELFKASRLASIWFCRLGIADHNNAIAPAMCGVAIDVPLAVV